MPTAKYLFRFGYCTPAQWLGNEAHGWDDESSSAFFVIADSPEAALAWGEEVAEAFVKSLFQDSAWVGPAPSWRDEQFAHWVEIPAQDVISLGTLEKLPVVRVGELPDFKLLVAPRGLQD